MIKATNLVKTFKTGDTKLTVLKGLDIDVKKGEFVSITGRSGSGKSTLLYQLGLLDHPDSGKIIIDGVEVSKLSERDRTGFRLMELGYVFQDYAIIPELTALENIMMPLLMKGFDMKKAEKQGREALSRVGLLDKQKNLPSQLSGGEQQRVSIARAIVHSPKIIFADEPTANLDAETAMVVMKTFLDLNREGQTIVMVTHEKEYADMTHRTLFLNEGILENK
ncbi:MAG: ABC transporter ATP-binding protein [Candidatus Pacebacteria bacterium]|nr:ABC transporter ATP-binding protein [Candidatus Paceibacterota bacterium]